MRFGDSGPWRAELETEFRSRRGPFNKGEWAVVNIMEISGDLLWATESTRVTLEHVRKKLQYRPFVGPDAVFEDLEGRDTIIHPAHVTSNQIVSEECMDGGLQEVIRGTVNLLLNCPQKALGDSNAIESLTAKKPARRFCWVPDPKLPFKLGTRDFLAIVQIEPAPGEEELVFGVLGRNHYRTAKSVNSRRRQLV
jgi:hypothetical protein